jgi:hypothetical protein
MIQVQVAQHLAQQPNYWTRGFERRQAAEDELLPSTDELETQLGRMRAVGWHEKRTITARIGPGNPKNFTHLCIAQDEG